MVETIAGPLGEIRGGTSKGVSLSTTAALVPFPRGTRHLFMTPRNFATAVVARIAINPWLTILKTTDALVTAPTDYSDAAQDGSTSTSVVLSSLDTLANDGALYVGAGRPFGGVDIDIDGANGNASVLTVEYWDGDEWQDITAVDGTDDSGATFGQDGAVTWTTPSDWVPTSLMKCGDAPASHPFTGVMAYWTRWSVSAALDSSTTLDHMLALAPSSDYFELVQNQSFEMGIRYGLGGDGCIEALTDTGTADLILGYASGEGGRF